LTNLNEPNRRLLAQYLKIREAHDNNVDKEGNDGNQNFTYASFAYGGLPQVIANPAAALNKMTTFVNLPRPSDRQTGPAPQKPTPHYGQAMQMTTTQHYGQSPLIATLPHGQAPQITTFHNGQAPQVIPHRDPAL
jgi:hypothetical protein